MHLAISLALTVSMEVISTTCVGAPAAVSYTHLTLPTTPYV